MRGYTSFILVFISILLISAALDLSMASADMDMSRSIIVERTASLLLDARETAFESLWQGASSGFMDYDSGHSIAMCQHCMEDFCAPPPAPNYCDPSLCMACFRLEDAKVAAESEAKRNLASLQTHGFDGDFKIDLGNPAIRASMAPAIGSRNGFDLGSLTLENDLRIQCSSDKLGISADGTIKQGTVIAFDQ